MLRKQLYRCVIFLSLLATSTSCGAPVELPEGSEPYSEPWPVTETTPEEPPPPLVCPPITDIQRAKRKERPYPVEPCREDFEFGPLWRIVQDQEGQTRDSEWVATIESGAKEDDLLDVLREHNIEHLKYIDERKVHVIAGAPLNIIKLIEQSCLIEGFDMTGLQCDCTDECLRARSCEFRWSYVDNSWQRGNEETIHGPALRQCVSEEPPPEKTFAIGCETTGPRGATWQCVYWDRPPSMKPECFVQVDWDCPEDSVRPAFFAEYGYTGEVGSP